MIHFNVDFSVFNSFSDITLELVKSLQQFGVPVSIDKSSISPDFSVEDQKIISDLMNRSPYQLCHIKWCHYWRQHFSRKLSGHINFEIFPINYEFKRNDSQFDYWIAATIGNSYKKLAISKFCRDVLINSGCPASNVFVMPLGFNPYLDRVAPPESPFKNNGVRVILTTTLSSDIYRFGTDILIQAFCEEFRDEDDVQLLIKEPGRHNYLIDRLIFIMSDKLGTSMPTIRYLSKFMSKEELATVYLSADAFVAPFRGEGFAIKILDAFAAGLPVAIPLYGGPTEYANETNCYPIEYDLVPVTNCYDAQSIPLRNSPHWAEPNIQSLRKQLRNIIDAPRRYQVAQRAKETAAQFSWERTAQKLLALIKELS